jgi:hypothetical protein
MMAEVDRSQPSLNLAQFFDFRIDHASKKSFCNGKKKYEA